MLYLIPFVLASLAPRVYAHGGVIAYSIGGNWYDGFHPYNTPVGQSSIERPWATYDPILDPKSSTVACNDDGNSITGQLTASVAAGSPITAYWNQVWPHPYGPMTTYLAQCPGSTCTGVNAGTLKWFKIDQSGLISGTIGNGQWGSGKMIAQNCSWTSTIPKTVPSGSYLIRFETIALHSLPAQIYPECAQLTITGGGSQAPTASELVSFPGAYSSSDPGLNVDLYSQASQTQTTYIIPGPPLYGTGGSGGGGGGGSTTKTTTTTSKTTSPSTPPTQPPGGTAAHYGQCGGTGWTGPTVCASPYTCQVLNDFYSQCL